MSAEIASARAFLFKRGVKNISPAKFAAAAKENKVNFGEMLYLIGLLYDGPRSSSIQRQNVLDQERLKLSGIPKRN